MGLAYRRVMALMPRVAHKKTAFLLSPRRVYSLWEIGCYKLARIRCGFPDNPGINNLHLQNKSCHKANITNVIYQPWYSLGFILEKPRA